MNYLLYTLAAMLAWGFWGFFPKLAVAKLDPNAAQIWNWVGTTTLMLPCVFYFRFKFQPDGEHSYVFAILAGCCGMIGGFFYNRALSLSGDNTSTVIAISALYPVISIVLTVVCLKQKLSLGQLAGVGLCVLGAVLLALCSGESSARSNSAEKVEVAQVH